MALSNAQVLAITDSIAKGISDFNANLIAGTASAVNTINAGVGGQGTNQTVGRILALAAIPDLADAIALLTPVYTYATQVAAYLASMRSLNPYLMLTFPFLNALDILLGGLNTYLVAQGIQVNGYVAQAFNLFCQMAVSQNYRGPATIPTQLSPATYFPYAAVDNLWTFAVSGATSFSVNQQGVNASTAVAGGGTGQMYLYKTNAGNAVAGSTFTITYLNAAGAQAQATYTTSGGTPSGSGSLAAGYAVPGAIGSAITAVSGTGMTAGEQYALGIQLVRAPAY